METPFKSRYEGRDKLTEMVETLKPFLESDLKARALTVHLLARIGSIDHEVEEWHKCQGCNSIDIWKLILDFELRLKLRQGLRMHLGRRWTEKWFRCKLRPSKMSIELHPRRH